MSEVADSGRAVKIKRNPKPKQRVKSDRLDRLPHRFRRGDCQHRRGGVGLLAGHPPAHGLGPHSDRHAGRFTDAITVVTPAEARKAEKRAAKAAKKSPLSERAEAPAFVGAWACFVVSACAVLFGIYLIVGEHVLKLLGLA